MSSQTLQSGGAFEANIIICCVRWYCSYPLSYRQAEIVLERGMAVNYAVFRWLQQYGPTDKRCRSHLRPANNDSWK